MATELLSTDTGPNGRVPMTHECLAADPGEVTPHLRDLDTEDTEILLIHIRYVDTAHWGPILHFVLELVEEQNCLECHWAVCGVVITVTRNLRLCGRQK